MEETDKEQVKPFAPLTRITRSDQPDEAMVIERKHLHCQKWIISCGFISAFLLVLAVTLIVLSLTLFHTRNPAVTMNSAKFSRRLELTNITVRNNWNATLLVEVSVRNPNIASFKFREAAVIIYYGEVIIGQGKSPPGKVKAKGTGQLDVRVDVISKNFSSVPSLMQDSNIGELSISSYTRVSGKVKILEVFKKSVVVKMDCTLTYNISMQTFQVERCRKHIGT